MKRRGKAVALAAAGLGCLTLAAASFAARDRLLESWHLRQLERGSPEERIAAADRLARLGSVRAVPLLLRRLGEELRGRLEADPRAKLGDRAIALQEALARIGERALPALIQEVDNLDPLVAFAAASTLEWVYYRRRPAGVSRAGSLIPPAWSIDPVLRFLRDDERRDPEVRQAAEEALVRLSLRSP